MSPLRPYPGVATSHDVVRVVSTAQLGADPPARPHLDRCCSLLYLPSISGLPQRPGLPRAHLALAAVCDMSLLEEMRMWASLTGDGSGGGHPEGGGGSGVQEEEAGEERPSRCQEDTLWDLKEAECECSAV